TALVDFAANKGLATWTFTAANGDTLTATATGHADPPATPPILHVVETAEITGGTGRFAGATGSFTMERHYDIAAGTTFGTFEGTIAPPSARAPAETRAAGELCPRRRALTSPGVRRGRRGCLMSGCAFLRKPRTQEVGCRYGQTRSPGPGSLSP